MRNYVKDVVTEKAAVVEMTKAEFIKLSADTCAAVCSELLGDMPFEFGLLFTMMSAEATARMTKVLFGETSKNDNKEDK